MRTAHPYTCSLGLSSQFYYCGLPVRLDAYSHCSFRCSYCFAAARGGAGRRRPAQVIDGAALARRFDRIEAGRVNSVLDQFLAHRQPLHFGGLSDPFPPMERRLGAALGVLETLADHNYPTVISTKSTLVAQDRYAEVLSRGTFLVQFSISSLDPGLMAQVDRGTASPTRRLAAMRELAAVGVPVSTRVQPLLPTREADAREVIVASAEAGAGHAAVEHLKVPLERNWHGSEPLRSALGLDIQRYFRERRAKRIGREWVLPVEDRLERQLALAELARSLGMTYAAADNDLLLLSDGGCCCSGVDLRPGFESYWRFNYLEAARRGLERNEVTLASLDDVWRPDGSISSQVNSHSRLPARRGRGAGIDQYLKRNWRGSANGCSPLMFYGLNEAGLDADGRHAYRFDGEALALYRGQGN